MIRLEIRGGVQKLKQICSVCKSELKTLHPDEIMIKPPNADITIADSSGSVVTRTEIDSINNYICEECE
jgi:hypothetical protein|tara:strand:- start:1318 stop:1524 length:207 start_codon:yes stop_codon:yes gene_type:complete